MSTFSLRDGLLIAGRYRIMKPLGRGAYGAVYEAVRSADGAIVALKMMHAIHAETTDALRFEREAELLKRLQNQHVVSIIDFGHHDEMPFLIFEHLAGRNLAEELANVGALGAQRTAWIARQILYALEEAHALSIVHRDIKPANIFLCDGPGDNVKVLDFGIAKALGDDVGAALTATGQMLGTAQYMAPEQVRGDAVDERVDLYSLGTVMAEMLTGERLVAGVNEIEVYMQHVSDKPLPLPDAVRSSPLGAVIARAVGKEARARYASAAAMGAEIDLLLNAGVALFQDQTLTSERPPLISSIPVDDSLIPRVSTRPLDDWEIDEELGDEPVSDEPLRVEPEVPRAPGRASAPTPAPAPAPAPERDPEALLWQAPEAKPRIWLALLVVVMLFAFGAAAALLLFGG